MTIKEITSLLEEEAPLAYSESFDNTGLLVGNENQEVTNVLITLDSLENVVEEAKQKKCNLIISFHPIIFNGLKKITGQSYVEKAVMAALKNDIAIYAIHTALDNSFIGVNAKICEKLKLTRTKILIPQTNTIRKLQTFVPVEAADKVRNALFSAGAGNIGNYSHCNFSVMGTGSFLGKEGSNPLVGKKGEMHFEEEVQIGVTYEKHQEKKILKALFQTHPYEEVAYEVISLENRNQKIGMGMVGELKKELNPLEFLKFVKKNINAQSIKYSPIIDKPIKKVAVVGGSGAIALEAAKRAGADAFISADFKYHDFFKAEGKILLVDVGHFESEQFTKELIVDVLNKKILNFAPALQKSNIFESQINTNPISYL